MKLRILLALLMTIVLNMSAYAETTDMNKQSFLGWAYNNGDGFVKDYKKAAYWFKKAALQGDLHSQKRLGYMYKKGQGVEQDFDQALYWFEKVALQSDNTKLASEAQMKMGFLYKDKKKDFEKAIYWFEKALLLNHPGAANTLGYRYKNGWGFGKDINKAIELFTKSAKQGNMYGQRSLGQMYLIGKDVKRDYKKAYYWFNKAALQGNEKAHKDLYKMRDRGLIPEDKIQEPMPTIEEAEADMGAGNYKEAFRKYTMLAEQGNADAYAGLAAILLEGLGLDQDLDKAFEYAKKSAELGSDDGKFLLGAFYYRGVGVNRDPVKGLKIMKKASRNDKEARELYEQLLEEYNNEIRSLAEAEKKLLKGAIDDYSEKRYKDAFGKFLKLSEQGNAISQGFLGDLYFLGNGTEKNVKKAIYWYKKGVENNDGWSQYALGREYLKGKVIEKDIDKGLSLLIKSAKQGNKQAKKFLDSLKKDKTDNCSGSIGMGTGFVVSKDGVVVTAAHVVTAKKGCACKKITVDGLEATIIDKDKATDTALLKVSNQTYEHIANISDRPLSLMEEVLVVGWPGGQSGVYAFDSVSTVTGRITGLTGLKNDKGAFRYDAPTNSGNSGGPIISLGDGKVVGLVASGLYHNARSMKLKELEDIRKLKTFNLIKFGKEAAVIQEMMNANKTPVVSKSIIGERDILEHYLKVTKYIVCYL